MGKYAALAAAVAIATGLSIAAPADAAYKARISKGTLTLTGNGKGEKLQLRLRPGNKNVLQVDVGLNGTSDFSLDRRRFKRIVVNAGGGVDTISIAETFGAFTNTEKTTLNGGPGNDRITGGRYSETYSGGPGDDWLLGKTGGDLFVWTSADGNDRFDGQGGLDVLAASGSGSGDVFDISPVLGRVRIARGADTLDAGTTEIVSVNGLGGDDQITGVSGLAALVTLDLSGGAGVDTLTGGDGADVLSGGPGNDIVRGGVGNDFMLWKTGDGADTADGQDGSDTFAADGSAGVDAFSVLPTGARFALVGPGPALNDVGSTEKLAVRGLGGNDTFTGAIGMAPTGLTAVEVDGGPGNDTLAGTDLGETLRGGDGNDTVDPNRGSDSAFLGTGNDTVQWDPGDGNDTVEGDAGTDRLVFNGSNASENVDFSAVGKKLRFFRDVANVTMTLGGLERADYNALGGTDTIVVNDLSATPVKNVYANLGAGGGGDGAIDQVRVMGTAGADTAVVSPSAGVVNVTGLSAAVHVTSAEPANDDVNVLGLGGADKLSATSGLAVLIGVVLNGGSGADKITGGDGPDLLLGETESDTILGGGGTDLITGGLGGDSLNGQGDADVYTCLTAGDTVVQDGTDTIGACLSLTQLDGGGGIRTHGTLSRPTVFKTVPFGRSGTPPRASLRLYLAGAGLRRRTRQVKVAGVRSVFPTRSTARTRNVWRPSRSFG